MRNVIIIYELKFVRVLAIYKWKHILWSEYILNDVENLKICRLKFLSVVLYDFSFVFGAETKTILVKRIDLVEIIRNNFKASLNFCSWNLVLSFFLIITYFGIIHKEVGHNLDVLDVKNIETIYFQKGGWT